MTNQKRPQFIRNCFKLIDFLENNKDEKGNCKWFEWDYLVSNYKELDLPSDKTLLKIRRFLSKKIEFNGISFIEIDPKINNGRKYNMRIRLNPKILEPAYDLMDYMIEMSLWSVADLLKIKNIPKSKDIMKKCPIIKKDIMDSILKNTHKKKTGGIVSIKGLFLPKILNNYIYRMRKINDGENNLSIDIKKDFLERYLKHEILQIVKIVYIIYKELPIMSLEPKKEFDLLYDFKDIYSFLEIFKEIDPIYLKYDPNTSELLKKGVQLKKFDLNIY